MIKKRNHIIYTAVFLLSACSVKNKIPKGTYLYSGAVVKVNPAPGNTQKTRPVKEALEDLSAPRPNKTIFGFPYKVAIWYAVGEPKKQSGFKFWLPLKNALW